MKPIRLRKIAKRDLHDAIAWYAQHNADIAQRFADEVAQTLELVERFPSTGGPVSLIAISAAFPYTTSRITSCLLRSTIA